MFACNSEDYGSREPVFNMQFITVFIIVAGLRVSKRTNLCVPRQVAPASLHDRDRRSIAEEVFRSDLRVTQRTWQPAAPTT